ncbi:DUF1538 family protein [Entomospira culicis]|uniref:DUF1538 family protein n=1 Tax=Entomospira culicis TaxID=2719989 RepID=A0A968KYZ7_9SPIO|nr:DUF1538 family protein [Entomospira culicis]NIZ18596.1 DUF1538 family protein [Entomospira culicis]NIZ68811.1 DUF1538 family protein [Entomospira culicis]WDI37407.1 DUF1538 family protein [Entomospira culicis]WDI39035.1 DUF1538 family protein [Entomospira culicis]
MNAKYQKITITPTQAMTLLGGYAQKKVSAQLKAISFISLYLIIFQVFILGNSLNNPLVIFIGLVAVVLGLAFFLEGLFLSVMPLAEMAGAELPNKTPLTITLGLAFALGALATLAEPAMVVLQSVANFIPMHQAPLLYYLFNENNFLFILALGFGVGFAMLAGSLMTLKNLSLKAFIITLLLLALTLSIIAYLDPRSRPMVALAWDAGGIATGAVTVPLIIAFGLGINRTTGSNSDSNGLGIVTLANLGPINALLTLSLLLRNRMPHPQETLEIFLQDPKASIFTANTLEHIDTSWLSQLSEHLQLFLSQLGAAITAVGPLVLALVVIIMLFIRKKPNLIDEKVLGVLFSIVGMFFLNYGIQTGLTPLGQGVGANVSSIIKPTEAPPKTIENFQIDQLAYFPKADGERVAFFPLVIDDKINYIPFEEALYDAEQKTYHLRADHPIFEEEIALPWGKMALFFAFFVLLGFGAVVAEPTLHALANTLSELTAGSFPKAQLIKQVALGVGIGLAIGVLRMMFDIPFILILLPLYTIALLLTIFSESTYMAIAWDAAGVATGPITVPLVIAVGLGLNQYFQSSEQFGFLTLGATIPILILLTISLGEKIQQRRLKQAGGSQ